MKLEKKHFRPNITPTQRNLLPFICNIIYVDLRLPSIVYNGTMVQWYIVYNGTIHCLDRGRAMMMMMMTVTKKPAQNSRNMHELY